MIDNNTTNHRLRLGKNLLLLFLLLNWPFGHYSWLGGLDQHDRTNSINPLHQPDIATVHNTHYSSTAMLSFYTT